MSPIPHDGRLDATLAFLSEGYRFVQATCERLGSDAFQTRLILRPIVCMMGADAARLFYDGDRFTRRGAMPKTTLKLLQDEGSVQTLDGAAHRRRKAMFMSLVTPESMSRISDEMLRCFRAALPAWERRDRLVLHDAVREVLCRAAFAWAGAPLDDAEIAPRAAELGATIDAAGSFGPSTARALWLRRRSERWAAALVRDVRRGRLVVPHDRPLHVVATYEEEGELLDEAVAAVELLNLLRPTVAIGRFVVFAALALHEHPEARDALRVDEEDGTLHFVQEVRRHYPFFPAIAGRARHPFGWRGHRFAEGDWALFDLYATNHDPREWGDPGAFRPERFAGRRATPYDLVPQGAGDARTGHRCPGEPITIELLACAARMLAREMTYEVPAQDLSLDLSSMPALPKSGLVLSNVRRA